MEEEKQLITVLEKMNTRLETLSNQKSVFDSISPSKLYTSLIIGIIMLIIGTFWTSWVAVGAKTEDLKDNQVKIEAKVTQIKRYSNHNFKIISNHEKDDGFDFIYHPITPH